MFDDVRTQVALELGALGAELVVAVAQLHRVVAAVVAPEVAEEDDDHRLVGPQVTETVHRAVLVGERDCREPGDVHRRSLLRLQRDGLGDLDDLLVGD